MNKIIKDFPKLPSKEKPDYFFKVGDDVVACVIKSQIVKFYYWDQIALLYNRVDAYERLD